MMRCITVLSLLLAAALPGRAQKQYTLEDCYLLALENNITVQRARNEVNKSTIDRQTARYDLLPALSYSMNHYFSFGKNIDPVTNNFVQEQFSGGETGMGLQLDLFSGFKKLNTIKQSTYSIRAAEYSRKRTELELLTNITLIYSRLLFNKEQAAAVRSNIRTTSHELSIVKEKIKAGRLTKYENYSFNARLNSELADLVTVRNDSSAALQELKQILNLAYKEEISIVPIDTIQLSRIYHSTFLAGDIIETVLQRHPAIKQAQMNEQVVRYGMKVAKSSLAPSLSARGNLSSNYNINEKFSDGSLLPFRQQLNDNLGQNINLSLDIPIFSKKELINGVKKEKVNLSNAKLATRETENLVVSNTLQLVNEFNAAKQKYQATQAAWRLNNLSYNLYQEKHRLGQVSSVELFTARDILNAASSKYIQAKLELLFRHQLLQLLITY
jgi:outer membrane protein